MGSTRCRRSSKEGELSGPLAGWGGSPPRGIPALSSLPACIALFCQQASWRRLSCFGGSPGPWRAPVH